MITDISFTKEWIDSLKMQNTKAYINPPLLEKMTYALSLAELLQLNGLDFIFKAFATGFGFVLACGGTMY